MNGDGAVRRLPIVGVMGSGRSPWEERARALGAFLARSGVHLLTGGGSGVMAAVGRAFCEEPGRAGLSIGVLPSAGAERPERAPPGYPNPWVEVAIHTHLPHSGARGLDPLSRNHVNVLSCDALVALPGGAGTASEVALALRYQRPLVAWLAAPDELPGLPAGATVAERFEDVAAFVRKALGPGA